MAQNKILSPYLSVDDKDWQLNNGDFTIEVWFTYAPNIENKDFVDGAVEYICEYITMPIGIDVDNSTARFRCGEAKVMWVYFKTTHIEIRGSCDYFSVPYTEIDCFEQAGRFINNSFKEKADVV